MVPIEMIHVSNRIRFRPALTMLEMIFAMAIMAIVFAVLVPQLKAIQNSWDTKAGKAEALQNGRILLDHLQRTLASAKKISAVSSLDETDGFIQFSDNESNTYRYDVVGTTTKYIKYGPIGQLADLAGPVSRFQVYCYDVNDMNAPLDPVSNPCCVRFVKVEATLTNLASMGQDLDVTASAYLRTGTIGDEAVPVLLFVSGGTMMMGPFGDISCVPTAQERLRINLMESWGYQVNLINHQQAQADFDDAVADANVAYVPVSVNDTYLDTKLRFATIGIVIEKMMTQFGISDGWLSRGNRDEIDIIDNSHYITSAFSTGLLTYLSSPQTVTGINWGQSPGMTTLASVFDVGTRWVPALAVIDIGDELVGGTTVNGRRVQLPWGDTDFNFNALNNDGKTIMKRAIEWAAAVEGSSGVGSGEETYRDEFNTSAYSGNDGSRTWSGDWQEINESDGPVRGDEVVSTDPLANPSSPTKQLRVRNSSEGVMREADLSGAVTATLSLQYRRENLDDADDYVAVEVSTNGTLGPWTEIVRFAGPDNDTAYQPFSQDISAYIDANFAIRFISSPDLSNRDDVWFDDVEILLSQ